MFSEACDHDTITPEQLAVVDALPEKHRRFIRERLKKRNGLVVECSPAISACGAFNTCMSFLGTARSVVHSLCPQPRMHARAQTAQSSQSVVVLLDQGEFVRRQR
jgi:hypothetical protein